MNITDVIWRNSHAWPDRLALLIDGKKLKYRALRRHTELVSARLVEAGVRQGDCVAVSLSNPASFVIASLALARMGAVVFPLRTTMPEAMKASLLERHQAKALVHDQHNVWRSPSLAPEHHLDFQHLIAYPDEGVKLASAPFASNADTDPWLVSLAPAAAGVPRSLFRTHWQSIVSISLTDLPDEAAQSSRLLVFTDPGSGSGMSEILRQLYAGGTVVLATSGKAESFFQVVERDQVTHTITTAGLVARLVAHAAAALPESATRCRSLQSIAIAGIELPTPVQDGVRQRICPQLEIRYGHPETGFIASADSARLTEHPQFALRIAPWVQAQAVDEQHQPVAPGQAGTLRFKTPATASAYVGDDKASASAFRDGWFYPGFKGAIDAAGYLRLV